MRWGTLVGKGKAAWIVALVRIGPDSPIAKFVLLSLALTLSACMGLDEWQALRIAKAECDRDGLIKVFDEKVWADLKAKSTRDMPLNHIADVIYRGSWDDVNNKYINRQIHDIMFHGKMIARYKSISAYREPPFYSWAETYETQFSCAYDKFPMETRLIHLGY